MAITTSREIQSEQLATELDAAGIDVPNGLGSHTVGDTTTIHTYDGDGHIVDLPAEAQAVVDAHVAVDPVDPRIAVIEDMDSISDADKSALLSLLL